MVKRVTSLLMAVVIVAVMCAVAFAVGKVEKIEQGVFVSSVGYTTGSKYDIGKVIESVDQNFKPGETFNIFLDPSKFVGSDVKFDTSTGMSVKDLEAAGVSIRVSGGTNSNLVQSASFKEKEVNGKQVALIQLKIAENLASAEAKDFSTKVTIYSNKVKQQEIIVSGTVGGSTVSVDSTYDYVFLGNGEVASATENIAKIEIDAGNDVHIFTRMSKGKQYYAVAHDNLKDADLEFLNKHEQLDTIYYLDTDGLAGTEPEVKINTPTKLFVYDANGKKLGTTDDKLALSSKYYLAKQEMDINSTVSTVSTESSETVVVVDDKEPEDGDYLEPVAGDENEIPNTGIGVMPKVAVAALVIGLVTIIIVILTGSKRKN